MATNVDIVLRLLGQTDVLSGMKRTGDAGEDVGRRFNKAGREIDQFGRFVKGAGDKGRDGLKGIGDEAQRAVPRIQQLEDKARSFFDSLEAGRKKTESLGKAFEGIRNWGAGLAVAGAGGLALGNAFAMAAQEGEKAGAKLDAMLKKRGEGGQAEAMSKWAEELADKAAMVDDDPIKDAAAGLLGFGVNAKQIQQIMPGLIGQSRLYGQSLDSVAEAFGRAYASGSATQLKRSGVTLDPKDLEALNGIEDFGEKQKKMFEMVKASMDRYALSITEGMSEAEKAANRFSLQLDKSQEALGKGASAAKQQLDSLSKGILAVVTSSDKFAYTTGYVEYMGSAFFATAGTVTAFAAQVGLAKLGMDALGISGPAALLRVKIAAWAANIPLTAMWVTVGKIAAVALIAAAAIYALDKAFHYKEDRELRENIAKGDATDPERLARFNEYRRKKHKQEVTMEQFLAWETDETGNMDPLGVQYKDADPKADVDKLQSQFDLIQSDKSMPSMPVPSMPSGATSQPAFSINSDMSAAPSGAMAVAATSQGSPSGDSSAAQSQIDSIQDQIDKSTSKSEKAQLKIQLRQAQRAKRDADKAQREADKREKAELRDKSYLAGAASDEKTEAISGKQSDLQSVLEDRKDVLREKMEDQVRAIRKQIKSKAVTSEAGQERIQAIQDAFQEQEKAMDLATRAQVARLEAQSVLIEAEAKASTQEGARKAATLRSAQAKAKRLRDQATRDERRAGKAEEDAREARSGIGGDDAVGVREAARAALARLARGRSGTDALASGGGMLRPGTGFPKQAVARPAGFSVMGEQVYTVKLVVPNQYSQDVGAMAG